jgi:antitoxin Phd
MEDTVMTIDTNTMISITEANQNFSKVTRLVDEKGTAVIMKNNLPRYLVIDFSKAEESEYASDEDVLAISNKLMKKNKKAYETLSKRNK